MVFSSFTFLFFFLPLCLVSYFTTPDKGKNLVLVLWSYLFYAWSAPIFFPLFIVSCLVDYFLSRAIGSEKTQANQKKYC